MAEVQRHQAEVEAAEEIPHDREVRLGLCFSQSTKDFCSPNSYRENWLILHVIFSFDIRGGDL